MRIHDNMPTSYHDELASWFPSWYRKVPEMDALWQVWGALLDQLIKDIQQVLDNFFVGSCDEETIEFWEEFLSISMTIRRTIEYRRRFIMTHFSGFGKCSASQIKSIIRQYAGSDSTVTFEKYDDDGNNWLNIRMGRGDMEVLYVGDVQFILEKIIPAHITHSLRIVQERNIRSIVSISRYIFEYTPAGVYPETAMIGRELNLTETYRSDIGAYQYEYGVANPDAVAGTYPETATIGRAAELVEAAQTAVSVFPVDYTQASENIAAGILPGSSTQ